MPDRFLRKLSVSHRIIGGFVFLVLLMALAIPIVIQDHRYITERLEHVTQTKMSAHQDLMLASTRIMSSRVNLLRFFQDYLPSVSFAIEDINQAKNLLKQARDLVIHPHKEISHIEDITSIEEVSKLLNNYKTLVEELQHNTLKGKRSEVARKAFLALKTGNDITQLIERTVKESAEHMALSIQMARREMNKRLLIIVSGFVITLATAMILALYLSRSITRPVSALRKGAEKFGLGKMTARVPVDGNDELTLLAVTFNTIAEQLQSSFSTLQKKEKELRQHRDNLEELVKERTREISRTNQLLKEEIVEREQIEERLRENQDRFASISRSANDAIIMMDHEGKISYWNTAATRIFGYTENEALGRDLHNLLVPTKYLDAFNKGFQNFVRTGTGAAVGKIVEMTALRKDGSEFPMELSLSAVKDKTIWHAVGVIRDITERIRLEEERKELENQLIQAQKLESVGILAGGLAHDFNNLLAVIAGNIDLATYETKPEEEVFEYLKAAGNASLRAKELTRKLITFSKGGKPVKSPGAIGDLLKRTANLTLKGLEVTCDLSLPEDLWLVEFDEDQMKHAIRNTIENAVEAMPDGGSIQVRAENFESGSGITETALPFSAGNYVKISIRDQGVGIPKEHIAKIFDPYFSTKEMGVNKGMGLGLSTTYSIIKKHDGHMTVDSEIGVGTTFVIYLPAGKKESEESTPVETRKPEKPATQLGKILVMDDEDMIRDLSRQILSRLGYESEVAQDGIEAVELYKQAKDSGNAFDVVILDLSVKIGMGGKDAMRKLLEIAPEVKAIVSSGYSNDPVMTNFEEYGFMGALAKPYEMNDLSALLNKLMSANPEDN